MEDDQKKSRGLESDIPLTNPAEDEFGYSGFAALLANTVVANKHPQGLVLAVHGKWGSGKSSLMNFIKYHLRAMPEGNQPVIIDFNPWWFEGREDTATQLLQQFSAQLSDPRRGLREIAVLIGNYSKEIAQQTAELTGYAWLSKPLALLLKKLPKLNWLREPNGIPKIKKQLAKALAASGKRFVFFIDDIDRLTPDETRDLFRAIKALADFPEVVYVLFFDREEVAKSLSSSLNMNGEDYLEKIVQAPFHLPAVDEIRLRRMLFKGLDSIIEAHPMPFAFELGRWNEVFHDGLVKLIRKPRDVVRILNSLSVVYPPLAGEVNPVDFVALEFLRVFQPAVYGSIRDDRNLFCGAAPQGSTEQERERSRLEAWRLSLPEASRGHVVLIVENIFPKVRRLLDTSGLGWYDQENWRLSLRPCNPDCYPTYFQFGIPDGHVTRGELDRITGAETAKEMSSALMEAQLVTLPDGHSKARDLLERLQDFNHLSAQQVNKLIEAVTATAHLLLGPNDEEGGTVRVPNQWRFLWLITGLLEQQPVERRQEVLTRLVATSPGLWMLVILVHAAVDPGSESERGFPAFEGLETGFAEGLARSVANRLHDATLAQLLEMPRLVLVVHFWHQWGDIAKLREVLRPVTENDADLLSFLEKFLSRSSLEAGRNVQVHFHIAMESLSLAIDIEAARERIAALHARQDLTPRHRTAVDECLQSLEIGTADHTPTQVGRAPESPTSP